MDISSIIEVVGAMIGLAYLYLEYKASFWLWSAGILMSIFYIAIFFHAKFYADMTIYAYYLGANVFGLMLWRRQNTTHKTQHTGRSTKNGEEINIVVTCTPKKLYPQLAGIFILLWNAIYLVLKFATDSPVPLGDAFTTSLSIIAMWLLAKKYIEHWWLWLIVNVVSVGLYFWKGLYPTAILFIVYVAGSVLGYLKWKKMLKS